MSAPRVRPAGTGDVEALVALEAAAFPSPWGRDALAAEVAAADRLVLVAAGDGDRDGVAGYAVFRRLPGEAELLRLAVAPADRRRGVARRLVERGLAELADAGAEVCHLEVRAADAGARAFYVACGFAATGLRRGYYADGEDAALYARRLGRGRLSR